MGLLLLTYCFLSCACAYFVISVAVPNRQDEAKALRQMQLLRSDMNAKEMEALNTAQELERMKDRAQRLETALQNAMEEINRKTEAANKWEFKAGEQQQQLSELERVRKALVSQLHEMREAMGPKDLQIVKTSERYDDLSCNVMS